MSSLGRKPATWWQLLLTWAGSAAFFGLTIPFEAWLGAPESLGQAIGTLSIPAAEGVFLFCLFTPWRHWRAGLKRLGASVSDFLVRFWRTVLFILGTFLVAMPVAAQLAAPGGPFLLGGSVAIGGALSALPYRRMYVRSLYAVAGRQPPRRLDPARLAAMEAELGLEPLAEEKKTEEPARVTAGPGVPHSGGSISGGTASPEVIRAWEEMTEREEQKREALRRAREQTLGYPPPVLAPEQLGPLFRAALEAAERRREPLILPEGPEIYRHGGWTAPEQVFTTPLEAWGGLDAQALVDQQVIKHFTIPPPSLSVRAEYEWGARASHWADKYVNGERTYQWQLAQEERQRLVGELRAQRRESWIALRDIADRTAQEGRMLTREEQAAWDCHLAVCDHLDRMLRELLEGRRGK